MEEDIYFFEGVEKLLEIWFTNNRIGNEDNDLRSIPRNVWEDLLAIVKCEIISVSKNKNIDAYVLSESSMFVSRRRWILKTCGTTTPLLCLKPLLRIVKDYGFDGICDMFYSRKNFSRPELQHSPHRAFCQEVEYLDTIFDNGRSYCLGSINSECWYLYTFSKTSNKSSPVKKVGGHERYESEPDQTIEILMENLDDNVMSNFSKAKFDTAKAVTEASGVDKILPHMLIDDFLFDPCGYSMNGIGETGDYMTIHITPESKFSYVSFESNVSLDNYSGLVSRVVKTFQPKKFIVTIFANKASAAYATIKDMEAEYTKLLHWNRTNMQCCNFSTYNLLFAQYTQEI